MAARAPASSRERNAWAMNEAISVICGSAMPCVVTDGVPMRRPLVTKGLRGSSGIVFLFSVIPASSSVAWPACR